MPQNGTTKTHELKKRYYAVAAASDKIKKYPDLEKMEWKPLKTKSGVCWKNSSQIHFDREDKAKAFYDKLKSRDIPAFKNWS